MNGYEIAAFIDGLAMRPGYHTVALARGPGRVDVAVVLDTADSDEMYAPSYRSRIQPLKYFTIDVPYAGMQAEGVCRRVLDEMAGIDSHEWREFLRYRDPVTGRWIAPLHPHRPEGERAWSRQAALAGGAAR